MKTKDIDDIKVRAWRVQQLRAIVFPDANHCEREQGWVESVFKSSNEMESHRRKSLRTDTLAIGDDQQVTLAIAPNKIVWSLDPVSIFDTPEDAMDREKWELGGIEEFVGDFGNKIEKWLVQSCPPIKRLAFAATLIKWTPTLEDAHTEIGTLISSLHITPNMSDMMFRINRPRPSKSGVEGLQINRLSIWTSATAKFAPLGIEPGGGQQKIVAPEWKDISVPEFYGCRLQIDINTVPEFDGFIPPGRLPAIWKELVELGIEVTEKGDIE
jgi:hypothetical protein